jgi:hypothetical protein
LIDEENGRRLGQGGKKKEQPHPKIGDLVFKDAPRKREHASAHLNKLPDRPLPACVIPPSKGKRSEERGEGERSDEGELEEELRSVLETGESSEGHTEVSQFGWALDGG